MNIEQMIAVLVAGFQAREPQMLRGAPGIGKSAGMLEAAERLAGMLGLKGGVWQWGDKVAEGLTIKDYFGYVDQRLSQCDPVDVGGLPYADHANGTQHRLCPSWFAHTDRADMPDYGILALEEIVSAPQSVQAAAYQFTYDRRIGDKVMKSGWSIVLTGNRITDGGVVFKMPTPLANRVTHHDIESDATCWRDWAIDVDVDLSLIAFIGLRPDLLNTFEQHVKEKKAGDAFATERTWDKVDRYLRLNLPDDVLLALVGGAVGEGPAAEFMGFRQVWQQMPNIDGILLDPINSRLPEDAATQYAVATALAARATKDNFDVVLQYVDRFGAEQGRPELGVLCVKDASRRDPSVMMTKAFTGWATRNKDLLG